MKARVWAVVAVTFLLGAIALSVGCKKEEPETVAPPTGVAAPERPEMPEAPAVPGPE